jgi:hypothetical protein
MTVAVRRVTLSHSADDLLRELAGEANMEPDVFGSLILESAIRDRHEMQKRFAAAAAKVCNGD